MNSTGSDEAELLAGEDEEELADLQEQAAYIQALIATPARFLAWVHTHADALGERERCTGCPVYRWLRTDGSIVAERFEVFSCGALLGYGVYVNWRGTWVEALINALDEPYSSGVITEAEILADIGGQE